MSEAKKEAESEGNSGDFTKKKEKKKKKQGKYKAIEVYGRFAKWGNIDVGARGWWVGGCRNSNPRVS